MIKLTKTTIVTDGKRSVTCTKDDQGNLDIDDCTILDAPLESFIDLYLQGLINTADQAEADPEQKPNDHNHQAASMSYRKDDDYNPRFSLLSPQSIQRTIAVLEYGAARYGANNWRQCNSWRRYYDAAQRHLLAWFSGEDTDQESGLPHIDHAACCIHFLQHFVATSTSVDDRFGSTAAAAPAEPDLCTDLSSECRVASKRLADGSILFRFDNHAASQPRHKITTTIRLTPAAVCAMHDHMMAYRQSGVTHE